MFKENVTAGFPEVSKLIDSAVSKKQEDQMKYSFFSEKKILHESENRFTMNTWKYHITSWIVL